MSLQFSTKHFLTESVPRNDPNYAGLHLPWHTLYFFCQWNRKRQAKSMNEKTLVSTALGK